MKYRNDLKRRVLAGLFAGAALCLAAPASYAVALPNTTLPTGGQVMAGAVNMDTVLQSNGNPTGITSATIHQNSQNAVIKWESFNVGANATVNFEKGKNYNGGDRFNTLNYVNSANGMSQIYGAINAAEGNIYIVNPAGVEISNSAQINVGSLYVSNKNLDKALENITNKDDPNIGTIMSRGTTGDAVLMSLGNINATDVTFEGNRIVIDADRIKTDEGQSVTPNIRTTNTGNVVIGYAVQEKTENGKTTYDYFGQDKNYTVTKIDKQGNILNDNVSVNGYMWVENVEQLQAINTNLRGSYALRNSIDATATQDWTGTFNPLGGTGQNGDDNPFTGKFDGLDYNIFNLNIDRADATNVGLFGVVGSGAVINNVTLVGGRISGQNFVGSLAGSVHNGAHISNITNSANVSGISSVGGIIGQSGLYSPGSENKGAELKNLINTGTVTGTEDENTSNIGGLVGNMQNGTLGGTSYNLGAVTAQNGHNVGGLVGHAVNATLGDGTNLIYNRLNVTGAYNVGGIVGNMEGSTVQNAENSGNVTATGYDENGTYSYHTAHYDDAINGVKPETVYIANAGGIAGTASDVEGQESAIKNVLNTGDVSSNTAEENNYTYYTAGNVGGIVGSAVDTNITDATNQENEIRGAHNVGGIAGYFANSENVQETDKYVVTNGVNDGGDIMATGARNNKGFVKEWVRPGDTGGEEAIIGNIGGIVGYMDGDGVYITASANRGTVHSQEITGDAVLPVSQAANAGGIVGKIDRGETKNINEIKGDVTQAAVSNSYSTGDVRGYMGVGGVAGMMYNGEIAGSYNLGTVNTTRNAESFGQESHYNTVNMGGIVGDTTEGTNASALLYDVYNKGQVGDETFQYYARHVGGIVGRLSGTVEKAYNTGAIYNGYNVVGGIAGWMYTGSINNAFNTGNITVVNNEIDNASSQVGGIVGAVNTNVRNPITNAGVTITNVYNLGTLRSFQGNTRGKNTVGGIIGIINGNGSYQVSIANAYTTGNIWAGIKNENGTYSEDISGTIRSIWGASEVIGGEHRSVTTTNTYYIQPDTRLGSAFTNLYNEQTPDTDQDNSNRAIAFTDKDNIDAYYDTESGDRLFQTDTSAGSVNEDDAWRIYDNSTPILNAFLPNSEKYFGDTDKNSNAMNGIDSIQYGTAYNPLLTIIRADQNTTNLVFNWADLGLNNAAGLAVYDAGLTLTGPMTASGSGYFGGLIYSDGALKIATDGGNVALGSASELYGSSVAINAGSGDITIYGSVTATGNRTTAGNDPAEGNSGSISIAGGSVDIYGQLTSAKVGETVCVPGIDGMKDSWNPVKDGTSVSNHKDAMNDIGDWFSHTTGASAVTGNISITANDETDGHVNVYYGNKGEGLVTTAGNLTVTASGDIYMDSDISIGGDLTLKAGYKEGADKPAADSEAVLDISNIGKVQAANGMVENALTGLHAFLGYFAQEGKNITLKGDETKLAVDMWGDGAFDLTKYDLPGEEGVTLANKLDQLYINGETGKGKHYTYIWVSTGEQLAGIQQYKDNNPGSSILNYNFALKNDIDASDVTDYKAIGTGAENGYTGTFDGRDKRIIGLDTTKQTDGKTLTNVGIFDTIGKNADGTEQVGTVEDLRVYSGTFTGTNNAGAVAGVNKGNISNVTAFGNVVDVQNPSNDVSYAGGIVGTNEGLITGASAVGTATQSSKVTAGSPEAAAGGIAGLNTNSGTISDSSANSAVNASEGNATALGGVAGVNEGTLTNVDSLGVTTGIYQVGEHNPHVGTQYSDNVGGIAGTNSGTVTNVYNESIVSGRDNVGGILGVNTATAAEGEDSPVSNVANASRVTGEANSNAAEGEDKTSDHVGGLVGDNKGSITNGRNNGEITGNNYVGGLVGNNGEKSTLTNLTNDSAAAITGDKYVGGIAGANAGKITASSVDEAGQVIEGNDNLINRGTITGQQYVGGVAGKNTGTIENTNNDVDLHVKNPDGKDEYAPQFFGGVAGWNAQATDEEENPLLDENGEFIYGTISNATNTADISANGAIYVGGVVGKNDGILQEMTGNSGNVSGASFVGGVIGQNNMELKDLKASNSGSVTATDGGAGGIVGENNKNVTGAELSSIGTVSGTTGEGDTGTGGIFGVNSGNITDSILENLNGSIIGTSNTGGLIGINSGKVETSSLKNEADIEVIGDKVSNIGGLIGQNTGDITGGRTDAESNDVGYYKYQIYNNGTITVEGNGTNIGGLIGTNDANATVTAGYNTGAIDAKNSTHVGGIAGANSGTLDQVFNTVINADGSEDSINGSSHVGGIAGTNTGTISDAYNTSVVNGEADSTGSIAGKNDSIIFNVYATEKGQPVAEKDLVGNGNKATHVYNSKGGFGEDGSKIDKDGQGTVADYPWRQYGDNNPILKVFLTQLTVNDVGDLVYNGYDQNLNLNELIGKEKNHITGPTGMKNPFEAYYNTLKPNSSYGDSELLYNVGEQVNAGTYQNWLASEQISAGKDKTVNNLGYDIAYKGNTVGKVGKAQISITLDDINRTYGDGTLKSSQAQGVGSDYVHVSNGTNDYGYSYTITNQTLTDKMKEQLKGMTFGNIEDQAVDDLADGKTTANAGTHQWSASFGLDENSLANNFTFGEDSSSLTVTENKSYVHRANIEISANPEQVYVGVTPQFSGTNISDVLVNGDTISDGAYQYGTKSPVDTSKPGSLGPVIGIHFGSTYLDGNSGAVEWDGVLDGLFKNYNVTFKPSTLTVVEWPSDVVEPPVNEHWNFLFDDNPWDRNRDFRERKANIHFIAGGMTL